MRKIFVIKIGTQVITRDNGSLDLRVMKRIAGDIRNVRELGYDVILVSSGAVGAGKGIINQPRMKDTLTKKQIFASVGQVELMRSYTKFFDKYGIRTAQVLVTKEDFRDRHHYLNMNNCFNGLLGERIVPIVNENDVVAITELVFTDNDELAGLVSAMVNAKKLLILTSVPGVFISNKDGSRKIIDTVRLDDISKLEKYISSEKTSSGRGGMRTKISIAKKAASHGIETVIACGRDKGVISACARGEDVGTRFVAKKGITAVKRRIAYSEGLSKGIVHVNKSAEEVLSSQNAASLLPVGVTKIDGDFKKGDVVEIWNRKNNKIGFGLAWCDSDKARESIGMKKKKPVIHYDHMFIEAK